MTGKGESAEGTKKVPIDEALYIFPPDVEQPTLSGSKCGACGLVMWPKQAVCARCFSRDTTELALSRRGTVWSSTVVRQGPGDYRGPVPYGVGVVELPEGVGVRTVFTNCNADEPLPVGTEVEIVFEEVGESGDGETLIGHKFAPVSRT